MSIRCRCSSGSVEQELYLRKIVIPKRAARAVVSLLMFSSSLLKKRKEGIKQGRKENEFEKIVKYLSKPTLQDFCSCGSDMLTNVLEISAEQVTPLAQPVELFAPR